MQLHTKKTRNPHVFKTCKKSKTRRGVGGNFFTDLVSRFRGTPNPPQSPSPLNVSSIQPPAVVPNATSQPVVDYLELSTLNLEDLFKDDAFISELQKIEGGQPIKMPIGSIVKVFNKLTFKGIKRYVCFNFKRVTYPSYPEWMRRKMKPILDSSPPQVQSQLANALLAQSLDYTTNPESLFFQFKIKSSYFNPNIVFVKNRSDVICSVKNNDVNENEIMKTFIKYFILCFNLTIDLALEQQTYEQKDQQKELAIRQAEREKQQQLQMTAMSTARQNMEEIMQVINSLAIDIGDQRKPIINTTKDKLLLALKTNDFNLIKQKTIDMISVLFSINILITKCKRMNRSTAADEKNYTNCIRGIGYDVSFERSKLENEQDVTYLLNKLNALCAGIKGYERSPSPSPSSSPIPSPSSSPVPPLVPVPLAVDSEVMQISKQIDDVTQQIETLTNEKDRLIQARIDASSRTRVRSQGQGGSKKTKKTKKQNK